MGAPSASPAAPTLSIPQAYRQPPGDASTGLPSTPQPSAIFLARSSKLPKSTRPIPHRPPTQAPEAEALDSWCLRLGFPRIPRLPVTIPRPPVPEPGPGPTWQKVCAAPLGALRGGAVHCPEGSGAEGPSCLVGERWPLCVKPGLPGGPGRALGARVFL